MESSSKDFLTFLLNTADWQKRKVREVAADVVNNDYQKLCRKQPKPISEVINVT